MSIAGYFIASIVVGAVVTLIIYGVGWIGKWWGGVGSAIMSSAIALSIIWIFPVAHPVVASTLGDVANNLSLEILKGVCTGGWVVASAVLGKVLP